MTSLEFCKMITEAESHIQSRKKNENGTERLPLLGEAAPLAFLAGTGVLTADSLVLFLPNSAFKIKVPQLKHSSTNKQNSKSSKTSLNFASNMNKQ